MRTEEINDVIDKIQAHRPFFGTNLSESALRKLKKDYYELLKDFHFREVEIVLDNFFNNGDNSKLMPDAYMIRKECLYNRTLGNSNKLMTSCKYCNRWFDIKEVHEHQDRCYSIKYIKRLYSRFFPEREVPLKELYNMSKEEFDKNYEKILDIVYSKTEGKEKDNLRTVIESRTHEREFKL